MKSRLKKQKLQFGAHKLDKVVIYLVKDNFFIFILKLD